MEKEFNDGGFNPDAFVKEAADSSRSNDGRLELTAHSYKKEETPAPQPVADTAAMERERQEREAETREAEAREAEAREAEARHREAQERDRRQRAEMAERQIAVMAGSAMSKAIASVILAWWPVTSLIAVFLGGGARKLARAAAVYAQHSGAGKSGKGVAASILGNVGLISGVIMSIIWGFYFIAIMAAL